MTDKIRVKIWDDHTYECSTDVIGRAGEGNVTKLELEVPDKMLDYSIYLDFEMPNGEKHRTPKLEVEDGVATYEVDPFILTDSGEIKVQLVSESKSGKIWKSCVKRYDVLKSINVAGDNGYIQPSGTLEIDENGNYDVSMFASAKVNIPASEVVLDSPLPIEVSTEFEMNAIIANATNNSVGAVYKYTGETGTYENGALYIVEVV